MTGLERIVEKISAENKQVSDEIIANATEQANQLLARARQKANEKAQSVTDDARKQADRMIGIAKSQAESITRTRYLQVRGAVVNDVLSAAYEQIESFSDKDYFDLLLRLCVRNAEKGEGVLFLNARDLARMPQTFEEQINTAIFERGLFRGARAPRDNADGY